MLMRLLLSLLVCLAPLGVRGAETWQTALSRMPLNTHVTRLVRTNCVQVMLNSFQSNDVVKALIFMPGATDEFYMFRRAEANLTNASPSLLDAVNALTNQTLIRVTFHPPLLLLHTDEDPLDPVFTIKHLATFDKLEQTLFAPHVVYNDRDWDFLMPILTKTYHVHFSPRFHSRQSWHFYRHSFAAWNLGGWEALQAITLAGKTCVTIERKHLIFEGDERVRTTPKLDRFPR
ncbi:MAG: hypothetical protein JWR19_2426 [Pedosphaera sp.]|nr:hypothetical protein [Pedosphaera sp.]